MLADVPGGISTFALPATEIVTGFENVPKLPMAATHANLPPSVGFEDFDKVPNLHGADLIPCRRRIQSVFGTTYASGAVQNQE